MLRTVKGRILAAAAIAVVLVPSLVGLLALQNAPWTHSTVIRRTQSFMADAVFSRIELVSVDDDPGVAGFAAVPAEKLAALDRGEFDIVSASEVTAPSQPRDPGRFVIAVIETLDLTGKSPDEQRALIESVDELAARGEVDAIVEATASDTLRAGEWGKRAAERLRTAGVIRCVLFDGGHHAKTLPLAPDILIVPVTEFRGKAHAAHWFTRDAVPLGLLKASLAANSRVSIVARCPRAGIPLKNRSGMAWLAAQAIRKAAHKGRSQRKPAASTQPAPDRTAPNSSSAPAVRFVSVNVPCENGGTNRVKLRILDKLRGEIRPTGRNSREVGRVYLGVTTGNSRFPHRSTDAGFDRRRLEAYLNERLPYDVTVLSEPLSVWDIYVERLSG